MFLETYAQTTVCLSYIRSAACVAFYLINSPFLVGWNVVVLGGLMILAMVLGHMKAILTFVFFNMFVTLRTCGEMYVNIAHLLFLFVLVCTVVCFVLCFIWCRNFCIIVSGKQLCWDKCRIVYHSLFSHCELSGRLSILSI